MTTAPSLINMYSQWVEYSLDFGQRAILFADILRRRGNTYLEHLKQGQPPVLVFDYDMIMDGRALPKPVNYALVRIIDRRNPQACKTTKSQNTSRSERRCMASIEAPNPHKRPIVVIDPRAGHGPGIGGSKLDSQIGVALNCGHPVYFILFFTEPEPEQTLARVQQAEITFLEEVARRHPQAAKPAVIGNCQAGWAAALLGADRPDIVGPMVFNGSPLSYWGGVDGANPMRYRGGLAGGVWLTSLWCDLGNGTFDGANLVAGFEDLNPANTLWQKQYHVWANIDSEEQRYLDFERWWGGFFKMNREEIHYIVDSLFVGNELESGQLQLESGKIINLTNLKEPIVVFASKGDNITPPQQALNWIVKVYGSVDNLKRLGKVIVYLLHERIGHLGIFVSSSVAEKEHKEIISSVEAIDFLAPGLYEMVIEAPPSKSWLNDHKVAFIERDMQDILRLDDGLDDEAAFVPVANLSRYHDILYRAFFSPMVRALINEPMAEWIRQLHPLRVQRFGFSDLNPWMWPYKFLTPAIKKQRQSARPDNPFTIMEKVTAESVTILLDSLRQTRDAAQELAFKMIYANPWVQAMWGTNSAKLDSEPDHPKETAAVSDDDWQQAMQAGGFVEAVVRITYAVMRANNRFDRIQFQIAGKIIKASERFNNILPDELKRISRQQIAFLVHDQDVALQTLTALLPTTDERVEAFEIANSIATSDLLLEESEEALLRQIKAYLKL